MWTRRARRTARASWCCWTAPRARRLPLFDRVLDLFDGADEAAVAAARRRWATAKAAGHALSYWQQGQRGWEKKATG